MDISSVAQNILYFLLASGLITLLIKKIFIHYFNKDIERFKSELKFEQIKFSRLYEKRANVVEEVYYALDYFDEKMTSLISPLQLSGEPSKEEKLKEAIDAGNKFAQLYSKNKIYFDEKTCILLDDINKKFKSAWIDFEAKDHVPREMHAYWSKAWATVSKDVPELKIKLRSEFRELLGVKNEQTKN